jgi:hypothetical protein
MTRPQFSTRYTRREKSFGRTSTAVPFSRNSPAATSRTNPSNA